MQMRAAVVTMGPVVLCVKSKDAQSAARRSRTVNSLYSVVNTSIEKNFGAAMHEIDIDLASLPIAGLTQPLSTPAIIPLTIRSCPIA
jgi:hypothetical protein